MLAFALVALSFVGCSRWSGAPAPNRSETGSIWDDLAANDAPLDIEWLGPLERPGYEHIQRLRYTSTIRDGRPQRVFALYARPEGAGPFPAILQIHGGGQTCFPHNVDWFVRHGYACLSFDWNGPESGRHSGEVTVWSPGLTGFLPPPGSDLRSGRIYQAVVAAMRGIDVLSQQPEVDADCIGIQGISWGGYLTWFVCGLDSRVKVAVAAYGIGGLAEQWSDLAAQLNAMPEPWRRTLIHELDPEPMFGRINVPIMFVSGTNDFFGQLPQAEQRMAQLRSPHRRSYSPNLMHNLEPDSVAAAMAWFDTHLKDNGGFPAEPVVTIETADKGALVAIARIDESWSIESVCFDYARGCQHPLLHCWLRAPAQRVAPGRFEAALPIVDATQPLAVIAQVVYRDQGMLSSAVLDTLPVRDAPGTYGNVCMTDTISAWDHGPSGWYLDQGTDFSTGEATLCLTEVAGRQALAYMPDDHTGRTVDLSTRLPADAARTRGNARALEIWTHDLIGLDVYINYGLCAPGLAQYEASSQGGSGWQCARLELTDLHPMSADADEPPNWNETKQLRLTATAASDGTPAVGLVRWVASPHGRTPRISEPSKHTIVTPDGDRSPDGDSGH